MRRWQCAGLALVHHLEVHSSSKIMAVQCKDMCFLPGYCDTLVGVDRDRYLQKIRLCCGIDPYCLMKQQVSHDVKLWPKITNMDIVNYLVFTTSSVTMEHWKNYKSLEAHNFFTSGWVNPDSVCVKKLEDGNLILLAKVNHSQSMGAPPLRPWLLVKPGGEVVTAHCNCMAGVGESCSHVGALLFAIEYAVGVREATTCTSELNKWLPSHVKKVPYLPVCEVDFSSASMKKRKLNPTERTNSQIQQRRQDVMPPSADEITNFYANFSAAGSIAAILSLIPPYNDKFVPIQSNSLPEPLTSSFYSHPSTTLKFNDLLEACETAFNTFSIDSATAKKIEEETKNQAQSQDWFDQRSGRVTASKMKSACRTDPANPSVSLIKSICYPKERSFSTKATRWGCEHEETARRQYEDLMMNTHCGFSLKNNGFFINPKYPHIGASPDGVVMCECCGGGVIEVKCPFCDRTKTAVEMSASTNSCLKKDDAGKLSLDRNHTYFYQVQTQLAVCNAQYCDFVVWSESDMFVERILIDEIFWKEVLASVTHFYKVAILPELIGRWFSALKSTVLCEPSSNDSVTICYCGGRESEPMISCTNIMCPLKKFHWKCLKIKALPRSKKWLCPDCKKI